MQVERNFIELNYNAHFKGQTKKKEAHPVAGQDCIRTTRLHGVTNQTSTKRIFTNVKISDLIQKNPCLYWNPKIQYNAKSEIPRAVMLQTQVFWAVTPCRCASSSLCFERSLCLHIQVQAGRQFLRPLETSQTLRLKTRRHIPEGFKRHLSSAPQKPILSHMDPDRTLTFYLNVQRVLICSSHVTPPPWFNQTMNLTTLLPNWQKESR